MRSSSFQLAGMAVVIFSSTFGITRWVGERLKPMPAAPAAASAALALTWERGVVPARAAAPRRPAAPKRPKTLPRIVAVDRRIAARVDSLRPAVKKRLLHAAKQLPKGVTLLVTSAYRTHEEQQSLTPTFGVKAKPGSSTHEDGRGIDVNVLVDGERVAVRKQNRIIGTAMASAGFRSLGAMDPVHYSIPAGDLGKMTEPEPALGVLALDDLSQPEGDVLASAVLP